MLKTAGKFLLALFLLGGIAVLSVQTTLEEHLAAIDQQWNEIRHQQGAEQEQALQRLLDQVSMLRERHPQREELIVWEEIIGNRLTDGASVAAADQPFHDRKLPEASSI